MGLKNYDDLNEMHRDVLREIGNIGSGNAATSLSTMLGRPVNIAVPEVRILDYETVVNQLGGPEQLLVGLLLTLDGDVRGMIMFLLHKNFAHMVLNVLMGSDLDESGVLDEMGESAIREVGNIMAASYVNAMSSLTGLNVNISVPELCIDMAGSILSAPAIYYANISDKIILIEDSFSSHMDQEQASSHILLIPEVDSLQKIMTSLGLDV